MLYFALIALLIAKKCAISRHLSASSTRPVAAKQPGPKPSRLPHLGPDAAASVRLRAYMKAKGHQFEHLLQ